MIFVRFFFRVQSYELFAPKQSKGGFFNLSGMRARTLPFTHIFISRALYIGFIPFSCRFPACHADTLPCAFIYICKTLRISTLQVINIFLSFHRKNALHKIVPTAAFLTFALSAAVGCTFALCTFALLGEAWGRLNKSGVVSLIYLLIYIYILFIYIYLYARAPDCKSAKVQKCKVHLLSHAPHASSPILFRRWHRCRMLSPPCMPPAPMSGGFES